jgi:hypothetical protein
LRSARLAGQRVDLDRSIVAEELDADDRSSLAGRNSSVSPRAEPRPGDPVVAGTGVDQVAQHAVRRYEPPVRNSTVAP